MTLQNEFLLRMNDLFILVDLSHLHHEIPNSSTDPDL